MLNTFNSLTTIVALLCLVFAGYPFIIALYSKSTRREALRSQGNKQPRFAVIVPAHNEALLIERCVQSILDADYMRDHLTLFVIADNCEDDTADLARAAGATVLERRDDARRGKPYALNWALQQLPVGDFDAFAIIDADCEATPSFFGEMAKLLAQGHEALQGYSGILNPNDNWLTRLSVAPGCLKYRLHFPGKMRLGLSCPLGGNGMCFSRRIIETYGWNAFSVAENWEYWAMLAACDERVGGAPKAVVYSQAVQTLGAGREQRERWARGRMDTLTRYWGKLLQASIRHRNLVGLDAIMELLKPSHSVLLLWSLATTALAGAIVAVTGSALGALVIAATALTLQLGMFAYAMKLAGASWRDWAALLRMPWYMLWKLSVSASSILSFRDRRWIRAQRH